MTKLAAIRDALPGKPSGDISLSVSMFERSVPEIAHFLNEALSVEMLTFQSTADDLPRIDITNTALTIFGRTTVFGMAAPITANVSFCEVPNGLLDISFDGTLGPDYVLTLQLVSRLTVREVGLSIKSVGISSDLPPDLRLISFELSGILDFGGPRDGLHISLTKLREDRWRLDLTGDTDQRIRLEAPSHVTELTGNRSLDRFLPKPLVEVMQGIALTGLCAEFSPSAASVSYFSLDLAPAAPEGENTSRLWRWEITSGLTIGDLACTIVLINPLPPAGKPDAYPQSLEGIVTGTVVVNQTPIHVTVQGSSNRKSLWTVRMEPPDDRSMIKLPSISDIFTLAGRADLLTDWPDGFNDIPDIVIHRLAIDFNPSQRTVDLISFHIGTAQPWILIKDFCELKDLNIALDIQDVTDAPQRRVVGGLQGTVKIGKFPFFVSVTLDDAPESGWQMEGRANLETLSPLSDLVEQLSQSIKTPVRLPQAIASFHITELAISFNTKSKDFTFNCDGHLKNEGSKEIKGVVAIDLKHRPDGSLSTHFSGQMTIGDLQFALIFDSTEKDKHLLAATYHDLQGQPRKSIKKLIEAVSPDFATSVPESLVFTVNDALLGYHKSGADSKWLFGVDIEGGLNLSDVKLPDFPLISQYAPSPDQTLKLAVQVVGTNKKFEKDEVAALIALSPGGVRLPNGDIDGLALAASLRLGQESKQLSLPIGLKKDDSTPDPGANPLEHSPASSAADVVSADTPHSGAHAVSADGMQWVMIQKSFGPVHFERVGISYNSSNGKEPTITGLLDAGLSAGGLTIALDGLSVTSPLSPFDPTFSLRGLGIDYRNGPLEIGGSFLKQTMKVGENTYTSFAGLAVMRNELLSLSAIGSYALKDGHPSLFIYAVLDYPLGGPSFFFVTGLAAGFGYNRALTIPTIDQVEAFPLIKAASSGQKGNNVQSLPAGQKEQQELLTTRLEELEDYIPRSVGEHFLAIGVRFTSFKRVDSFALLTVKFGKELEFDLLGISKLSVPNVAVAQLVLKATFKPDSGFLGVRAQLTPNSYILSGDCHLTGGFAFYSWFKDQPLPGNAIIRGGDFVLTLGGYHPAYDPPAHYPRVPRLGFNWQVEKAGSLQLKGEAYYAMTPHALMAGCHLEATWHKDQLKAWFTASADFLICWEPYHYDARLYIDLGASYTFDLFGSNTITVDLGADLHLWGPEFSGEARIHWLFISFTVSFGEGASTGLTPIEWTTFKTAFLPEKNQICGIAVQQGLIRQVKDGVQERWIMNPKEFVLVTNSVIPSTAAREVMEIQGKPTSNPIAFRAKTDLAVRPVAVEKMQSTHQITITKEGEKEFVPFAYTPVLKAMPAALWGAPQFTDNAKKDFLKPPDIHDDEVLIEKTLAGFEIRPLNLTEPGPTEPFEPRLYETELIPDAFEWEDWTLTNADLEGKGAWEAATRYQDPGLLKKRDLVFKALGFTNTGTGFLTTLR